LLWRKGRYADCYAELAHNLVGKLPPVFKPIVVYGKKTEEVARRRARSPHDVGRYRIQRKAIVIVPSLEVSICDLKLVNVASKVVIDD